MIDKYLEYLHEDDEQLNEFVVLPLILLIHNVYKKYTEHKRLAKYCIGLIGIERKKCFIKNKINALEKAIIEIQTFKTTCKKYSKNISKCLNKIDKEVNKLRKEIKILQTKLAKLG